MIPSLDRNGFLVTLKKEKETTIAFPHQILDKGVYEFIMNIKKRYYAMAIGVVDAYQLDKQDLTKDVEY